MSADRDDQVIAAYSAGEDVGQIGRRFGVSAEEVRRIVAAGTRDLAGPSGDLPGAGRPRRSPLAVAGIVLIVLGLVGPCAVGALWLAIFYLSQTEYPVHSWGYGNLAVGFSGVCTGAILALVGLILMIVSPGKR